MLRSLLERSLLMRSFLGLGLALALGGCSTLMSNQVGKNTETSSLVDFLYPTPESRQAHEPETPLLQLPVRVGLAFVPNGQHEQALSLADQQALLEKVKVAFIRHPYIDRIELIPSLYLPAKGGFEGLEQVARLYDVELMALVSYDQVARSRDNSASMLYLTIAGLYVIPGNDNSTRTFVDTAVFDVASRKMLFRAPGISLLDAKSTALGIDAQLERDSQQGFVQAMDQMIYNLDTELAGFKRRIQQEQVAKVQVRPGYRGNYGGGGALAPLTLLLLAGTAAMRVGQARRRLPAAA